MTLEWAVGWIDNNRLDTIMGSRIDTRMGSRMDSRMGSRTDTTMAAEDMAAENMPAQAV